MKRASSASSPLALLAAPLFVILWSTGFIGAKYGLPHVEPMTFLSVRFALTLMLLGLWIAALRAPWPRGGEWGHLIVVGALLHGTYLGTVFTAIWLGVAAGIAALIVSLQPIATAFLARWVVGERLVARQWIGLGLGIAGVALVLERKLDSGIGDLRGVALCFVGLFAISYATLHQKRYCADVPMKSGNFVQYLGALIVVAPLALLLETNRIEWTGEFVFALLWLVLVLSLGAVGLLMLLIKRGAASSVASLFFLVPPCTSLMAWGLFGETLGPLAIFGMALAVIGVALVVLRPQPVAET